MKTHYLLTFRNPLTKKEGMQHYGEDLEAAKKEANYLRLPQFKKHIKDCAVYEVKTFWSEDRSYANSVMKKVY